MTRDELLDLEDKVHKAQDLRNKIMYLEDKISKLDDFLNLSIDKFDVSIRNEENNKSFKLTTDDRLKEMFGVELNHIGRKAIICLKEIFEVKLEKTKQEFKKL